MLTDDQRMQIITEAKSWIGVKFKKGGRDRIGIDCVGLLVNIGRELGFDIQDTIEYSFHPEPAKFVNMVYGQTDIADPNNLRIGNLLLFRQSVFPMHTGILSKDHYGRLSVINANALERKVVEQPLSAWQREIIAVRDYKGM
jgi:hypothetical protein